MEIILAIVVASAVIFFGALISIGNERQRRAIDELNDQFIFWATLDLQIKRERLVQNAQVPNPLNWFNQIVTKALGYETELQITEMFNETQTLICSTNSNHKILITTFSPKQIDKMKVEKRSRLAHYANQNPLLALPRKIEAYNISILNGGILFDIELKLAWESITGQKIKNSDNIWLYKILE